MIVDMGSVQITSQHVNKGATAPSDYQPERMYDRHYFNGGDGGWGGYAQDVTGGGSYSDYLCHETTARHILTQRPESVLEIGCGRAYVLKRIQDAGLPGSGLEVSKHCYLTRVCDGVKLWDLTKTPWPVPDDAVDLLYSMAVLEHIPANLLPAVIGEMVRVSARCLHGIDYGTADDRFDRTHCTLRDKAWWTELFSHYYCRPGESQPRPHALLDKNVLELTTVPEEVRQDGGYIKLNIASAWTMFRRGWINSDLEDCGRYAERHGYRFYRHDVRQGIPVGTGEVYLINASHFLEHLNYHEGLAFLRECRRVIRPDGALRLAVPDAARICGLYAGLEQLSPIDPVVNHLEDFQEVQGWPPGTTDGRRLWALLCEGHQAAYDAETLTSLLGEAGFASRPSAFRTCALPEEYADGRKALALFHKEGHESLPDLTLFVDAVPLLG